jgi:N,N'-diacetyllegionaminate synthase
MRVTKLKTEIIAELGQGFEGNFQQARMLILASASAGADAAKFQMVYADELATPEYKHYSLFKSLEMSETSWRELATYAQSLDVELQVDVFGVESLRMAEAIGVRTIKLHGTDIANQGLLRQVKKSSINKILLGAGGAYRSEIDNAIKTLSEKEVVILLGFQGYPTPIAANQIARVRHLVEVYEKNYPKVSVGFADHALPDESMRFVLPILAIGSGATVLEKHLTLGRSMQLEDHESALNPDEFLKFSKIVRESDEAIGCFMNEENFGMSESEEVYRKMIRRHVVASRNLRSGESIGSEDLVLKRTSSEYAIANLNEVYQKKLRRNVIGNSPITLDDIYC